MPYPYLFILHGSSAPVTPITNSICTTSNVSAATGHSSITVKGTHANPEYEKLNDLETSVAGGAVNQKGVRALLNLILYPHIYGDTNTTGNDAYVNSSQGINAIIDVLNNQYTFLEFSNYSQSGMFVATPTTHCIAVGWDKIETAHNDDGTKTLTIGFKLKNPRGT